MATGANWCDGVTAVITAGGRSSRFGQDKLVYPYGGTPLLVRVAKTLDGCQDKLLIAPDDRYRELLDWPRQADRVPPCGPLGGLYTALTSLRTPWLAFAAGDMPHLVADYWPLMAARRTPSAHAVVAENPEGRLEPLAALYHQSMLAQVETQLARQHYTMHALFGLAPVVKVPWGALQRFGEDLFWNVNYLHQLGSLR